MELAKIEVNDYGGAPFASHNMPCPICREKPAVLSMNEGTFQPCWSCQRTGWVTVKAIGWRRWVVRKLFGRLHVS